MTHLDPPRCVAIVGEGHVACPQGVQLPQCAQAAVNGVPSFHAYQGGNLSILKSLHNAITGGDKLEGIWVLGHKTLDHIYLVQECPCGILEL